VFNIAKPCKSCTSFVLIPKEKSKIKMTIIKEKLENLDYNIRAFTGSLISIEKKCKINIYSSGKTVIKTTDNELVEEICKELSKILYSKEQGNAL